ncbi:hypothetical protein RRF57_008999 [Xylaria bambusicola]|uniref:Uncharacterized protein n=1 Tax=Xylaria bambusicola TaxID=326684 RepID=A0AAN7UIU0_9PEZI
MSDHPWPESMRKRGRDDEEGELDGVANSPLGFTEHRNKRLQSLPLRASPTQKYRSGPLNFLPNTTMTPSNSDSDPEDAQAYQSLASPSMDVDQDADMAVDNTGPSDMLHSRSDAMVPNVAGRMPTPIHCTFAAQVRGNGWGAAPSSNEGDNAAMLQHNNVIPSAQSYPRHDPTVPRSLDGTTEWSMVQNRRLPSPISENGGEDVPTSPGMVLDNCSPVMAQIQRPHLPHMAHTTSPHAMPLHPNIRMSPQPAADADAAMLDTDGGSPSSAPATPSPRGKFGHSRSKHTLNNWTLQPGMKKSFSIGYRADCEKCRMKIPGHFNHIIIS